MAFMVPYVGADPQEARRIRSIRVKGSRPAPKKKQPEEIIDAAIAEVVAVPEPPEFPNLKLPPLPPAMRHTLFEVSRKYKVHPNEIVGPSRRAVVGMARREYCYICKMELKKSYSQIGRTICKDHTTVLYAVKMWIKGKDIRGVQPKKSVDCG